MTKDPTAQSVKAWSEWSFSFSGLCMLLHRHCHGQDVSYPPIPGRSIYGDLQDHNRSWSGPFLLSTLPSATTSVMCFSFSFFLLACHRLCSQNVANGPKYLRSLAALGYCWPGAIWVSHTGLLQRSCCCLNCVRSHPQLIL